MFQKNGFEIDLPYRLNKKSASPLQVAAKWIVAMLFFLSFGGLIYHTLQLDEIKVSIPIVLAVSVEISLITLFRQERWKAENKARKWYPLIIVGIIALVYLIFQKQFTEGLCSYLNQAVDLLMNQTGEIHSRYAVNGDPYIGVQIFSAVLAAILAYICVYMVGDGKIPVAVILPIVIVVAVCTGMVAVDLWLILFLCAVAMVVIYRLMLSAQNRNRYQWILPVILIAVAGAVILTGFVKETGLYRIADDTRLRDGIVQWAHEKHYEDSANPMPEGYLNNLGPFQKENRTALQVSMNTWEHAYLKGFVGEVYQNGRWTQIRDKRLSDESDLFYWLHQQGFYGQSQLGDAYSCLDEVNENFVSISIVNGCKKYCYTPYGLNQTGAVVSDAKQIGDVNVTAQAIDHAEEYIVNTTPNAVKNSYKLQTQMQAAQGKDDETLKAYLNEEEAYRKTVYSKYLQIPAKDEKLLQECLGEKEKLSTTEAKLRILDYLGEHITYRENIKSKNKNQEFLTYFLTKSRAGYAPHYATAAVEMLRYYGVPARYVEGYILPSSLTEEAQSGVPISVSDGYAHAWAEYYLDGVGWIPFETTPKYIDEITFDQTNNTTVSGAGGGAAAKLGESEDQSDQDEDAELKERQHENPQNNQSRVFVFQFVLVLLILLILAAAAILITYWRRKKLRRFLETMEGEDLSLAIWNAFSYSADLLRRSGVPLNTTFPRECIPELRKKLGEEDAEMFLSALEACEFTLFSKREPTEEQRETVLLWKNRILTYFTGRRGKWNRFCDKWIRCIY